MEHSKKYQFEKVKISKKDLNIKKPIRKSDGNPKRPTKIAVLPNDDNDSKPYNLLNIKKSKDPKTSELVIKKVTDLTPHDMKSIQCTHHTETMLCIPQCANMLKPMKPFKETVQYFRNLSLNCTEKIDNLENNLDEKKVRFEDKSPTTIKYKIKNDEEKPCMLQLSGTGLINVMNIEQTNLIRKSAAGREVLNQNEKYNTLLNSQRACSDQVTQTIPGDVDPTVKPETTFIDSDLAVIVTQSTGVDPMMYDDDDEKFRCEIFPRNILTHYSSEDYLNQFPPDVVINRLVKLALITERHLDQNKQKLINIGRFSNEDEVINYAEKNIAEIVDNITIDMLFTISSDLGSVSLMDWHPGHDHMVAVSYKSENLVTYDSRTFASFIYIWNLNNTKNPERIYKMPTRYIVCMEFSKWKPYLLLVIGIDGKIRILDVLRRTNLNINNLDTQKHIIAINNVHDAKVRVRCASWYNFDDEDNESFLCCKEDGKIWKYTVKPPSFEIKLLIKFSPNISLNDFPLCSTEASFNLIVEDVRLNKNDIIYVATGEGKVHTISQSSKEILHVCNAHEFLITSFEFSPFVEQIFLTSSYDGLIKIWWEKIDKPLFIFENDAVPVSKARWHPKLSTVIISIAQTEVHLWDIAQNKVKPFLIQLLPCNELITDFVFSKNGINLLVGGERGNIFVFKILTDSNFPTQLQVRLLCKTVLSWTPPRTVSLQIGTLYPWVFNENITVEKNFDYLKKTHPILIKDPIKTKTLAEVVGPLVCTTEDIGKRSEKLLKMNNKCINKILKRLCKCDDKGIARIKGDGQNRTKILEMLLAE